MKYRKWDSKVKAKTVLEGLQKEIRNETYGLHPVI